MALAGLLVFAAAFSGAPTSPALKRSDVVFMYQATPRIYADYGATVLAWGGTPTPQALADARGVRFFGSVGMVTEFARYHNRFPDTYEQGLCRDVRGNPVKVPWLTDMTHQGIPYWWCCTQQPQFRQFLRERIIETMKAGAAGLHVDDHLGTSGGLWLGLCFCDRCVEGFRTYLMALPAAEGARLGVTKPETFDFRAVARAWLASDGSRQITQHPLWPQWTAYQCRAAAAFMSELRELAATTAGRPVPVAANAGLLWPRHLADYKALDLFSAETDHHAESRRFSDNPLLAYRLAEAVERPYASTASGQDWAFIKEKNLPGLVRGWIALSYAAGQRLMAPHHQWCYTPEKGTHWYDGPTEKFAPLYRFVRDNAALFDGYETYSDLGLAMPHRAFAADAGRWIALSSRLAEAGVSYRVLLGGDEIVDHALAATDLDACRVLLAPDREVFLPADRRRVETRAKRPGVYGTIAEALAAVRPAVRVSAPGVVRALPRVKTGSAVIHLLNWEYDAARDDVRPLAGIQVSLDLKALGVPKASTCRYVRPDAGPLTLPVKNDRVNVPALGLWGLLVIEDQP